MKKILIVYYTWSNGNTARIARKLQSVAGGELLQIDTAVPYAGNYDDVVNRGQDEVRRGVYPARKIEKSCVSKTARRTDREKVCAFFKKTITVVPHRKKRLILKHYHITGKSVYHDVET